MKFGLALLVSLSCWLAQVSIAKEAKVKPGQELLYIATSKKQVLDWGKAHCGFGQLHYSTVKTKRQESLVLWFDPYSGRTGVKIYLFARDGDGWELVAMRLADGIENISVGLDKPKANIVIKTENHRTLFVQPVATANLSVDER